MRSQGGAPPADSDGSPNEKHNDCANDGTDKTSPLGILTGGRT